MDEGTKATLRRWLRGAVCTGAQAPNGLPLLRFGSFGLWIASPWRIARGDRIVVSSDSEYSELEEALSGLLIGQKIQSVEIYGAFHDLQIQYESGLQLEIFCDSGDHENWNLVGSPEKMIIAGPGSSWSGWGTE